MIKRHKPQARPLTSRARLGHVNTDDMRRRMEGVANELREAVRQADPKLLLAYLWFRIWKRPDEGGRDNSDVQPIILAMEYVHAVHAGDAAAKDTRHDEQLFAQILAKAQELTEATLGYIMVSTKPGERTFRGGDAADVIFSAKASWVLIRGNRYIPLEEEFFAHALAPHDEILRQTYGAGATEIAREIQSVAFAMTRYAMSAPPVMEEHMRAVSTVMEKEGISQEEAMKRVAELSPDVHRRSASAIRDLLFGEHCNLSKHSRLPQPLLDDLAFEPGANTDFFAAGELCGTPLRTLPARIRPLIHLPDGYYASDPNFVRDSSYRAIQRGIIARRPDYREEWNRRQKELSESALPEIFGNQLSGARIDRECYYPGPQPGQWTEIDTLVTFEDVLIHVEAKAGVTALVSPETNFDAHLRAIDRLIVAAYDQCRRFFDYLASAPEVPIFRLTPAGYEELRRLRLGDYRLAIPIGLTMESFTPFSSMSKELSDLRPILQRHAFISLAIDDLWVLRRFLTSAGALIHYLEVRQASAAIRRVVVHDEIDHLGSYLQHNRYDKVQLEQLGRKNDLLIWDGYSSAIDEYFGHPDFEKRRPPSQEMPATLQRLLDQLANTRQPGWLRADALLRNLSGSARDAVSRKIDEAIEQLKTASYRAYHLPDAAVPVSLVVARAGAEPSDQPFLAAGSAAAVAFRRTHQVVVVVRFDDAGAWQAAYMLEAHAPENDAAGQESLRIHAQKILGEARKKAEEPADQATMRIAKARKMGRNEPCWCGSGRKFKRCHGAPE